MKIYQSTELSADPTTPMNAVTKQYVDALINQAVVGGGTFITNFAPTSTGIVGQKQYVPNTVPANRVITDGTTDTPNVRMSLIAEGTGSFYSPTITISSVPLLPGLPAAATITEDSSDKRFFNGYIDLTGITSGDYVLTATSSTGSVATATIHRAAAGPTVSSATIGALPGTQTEAKSGDIVPITGVVDNTATYAEVIAGGAASALSSLTIGAADSAGAGFRTLTGTFTVSSLSGVQSVQVRASNSLGTFGTNTTSTNTITLNQTFPTIGARTISYPATQSALKGSETANVASTITNADTVTYTSSTDLSITNPSVYAVNKTVTRLAGGYVVGTANYTITANKASNNATSTATAAISIASTAPAGAITIVGSPTRLQSSAAGVDYTVRITPTQTLNAAPILTASSGTWQGSWTQSGGIWSRVLRIVDTDPKGAQTFSGMQLTGLANVVGTTITAGSTYTVGGFATRTITFPALARFAPIGTTIVDITKVTSSYTGGSVLTRYADTADHFQGFTIVDASGNYSPTGGYLYISDSAFAGSNTSGTLQLDIAEAA